MLKRDIQSELVPFDSCDANITEKDLATILVDAFEMRLFVYGEFRGGWPDWEDSWHTPFLGLQAAKSASVPEDGLARRVENVPALALVAGDDQRALVLTDDGETPLANFFPDIRLPVTILDVGLAIHRALSKRKRGHPEYRLWITRNSSVRLTPDESSRTYQTEFLTAAASDAASWIPRRFDPSEIRRLVAHLHTQAPDA
jgi:hypothetical protein